MKSRLSLLLLVASLIACTSGAFPKDFLWGSATASYQVEGAWNVGQRGLTIWDIFAHTPGKVANNENGDVADDHFHRFLEDIALMKKLGLKNYRLSLAWSRLFPQGYGPINAYGLAYYSDVINALLANDIQPFVTLFHWDLPAGIAGGWLNSTVVDFFAAYADTVFSSYGDRVKHWITFNEPLTFTVQGYGEGTHAPGRCSNRAVCKEGNSSTEPYIAAHNVLLAHSEAVFLYKRIYQPTQKGIIGITLNCDWAEPYSNSSDDALAAQRRLEFQLAWYADPVFKGDYPQSMKDNVGSRLPQFSDYQKSRLRGSWDYFGLNHYTTGYAQNAPTPAQTPGWDADQHVNVLQVRNGQLIGPRADSPWLYVVPWGIHKMLVWVSERYGNPPIYITENGVDVPNENSIPLPDVLHDRFRIDFYDQYISNVSQAITEGVDVRGYFAWSFMDNFEWADGYTKRFGLHYVDYKNNLTRYAKDSAIWYSNFINFVQQDSRN